MELGQLLGKAKETVFSLYPNVFEYDVKGVSNGGNSLKIVVTFKTSLNQTTPQRARVTVDKDTGMSDLEQIYETDAEKIEALKENGSVDSFVRDFLTTAWTNQDVDRLIRSNEQIIGQGDLTLFKEKLVRVLMVTKERMRPR